MEHEAEEDVTLTFISKFATRNLINRCQNPLPMRMTQLYLGIHTAVIIGAKHDSKFVCATK